MANILTALHSSHKGLQKKRILGISNYLDSNTMIECHFMPLAYF